MARATGNKRATRPTSFQQQQVVRLPQQPNVPQQPTPQQFQPPIMIAQMHSNQAGIVQHQSQANQPQYQQIPGVQQAMPTPQQGMVARSPQQIMIQQVPMQVRIQPGAQQSQAPQGQTYYRMASQNLPPSPSQQQMIVQGGRIGPKQIQPNQYQQISTAQLGPNSPQQQQTQQQTLAGARMVPHTIVQSVRKQAPSMASSVPSPSSQQQSSPQTQVQPAQPIRFQPHPQQALAPQQIIHHHQQQQQLASQSQHHIQQSQQPQQPIQHPQLSQQINTLPQSQQPVLQNTHQPQIQIVQYGIKRRPQEIQNSQAMSIQTSLQGPVLINEQNLRDPLVSALERNKNKQFFSHTLHRTFGPALAQIDQ